MRLIETLEAHLDSVRSLLPSLDVGALSGKEAARLAARFVATEHACAGGKALCARRVAETHEYAKEGHKDATSWLADASGESRSSAQALLETAGELDRLPLLTGALLSGELSEKKAHEIARAGAVDPLSEKTLVDAARECSLGELKDKADLVKAAARSKEDAEQRHKRIQANRSLATFTDPAGALVGRFSLTPEDGAVVIGRLEAIANRLFDEARRQGRQERRAAYLADALVALADGDVACLGAGPANPVECSGPGGTGALRANSRPDYTILMRVDLEALVRGFVERGEECSIDGTGQVPVSVVEHYLEVAKLRLIVTKGTAIHSVFSFARTIPAALQTALQFRDRSCVVPGCTSTFHLEIDHIKELSKGGPTTLSNLCRLCRYHHKLKSTKGYRIEGGPGAWRWVAPTVLPPTPAAGSPPTVPPPTPPAGSPPHERIEQVCLLA